MTLTHEEFLEVLAQYEREETSTGGIIGQATFSMGYKAFLPGYSNEDSWWPFSSGEAGAKDEAEKKCKDAIDESGIEGKRPHLCYGFILHKDTVKDREVSWQQDRYFVYAMWTQAAKDIIAPAIREHGIAPGKFWGRWVWKEDPSGRMETDQEGNQRVALIAYPAQVYASEAEAQAAVGGDMVYAPPEWLVDMVGGIKADREANLHLSAVRAKYSVDEETATALKSSDLSKVADAIAKMTGESATVIASLL